MLSRLIYASESSPTTNISVVQDIVEQARVLNERRQLTGMLLFNPKWFLQVLEGSREAVSTLVCALSRDPRHHGVQLLEFVTVDERMFATWSMGYAAAHTRGRVALLRFSAADCFEPAKMTSGAALGLLRSLAPSE